MSSSDEGTPNTIQTWQQKVINVIRAGAGLFNIAELNRQSEYQQKALDSTLTLHQANTQRLQETLAERPSSLPEIKPSPAQVSNTFEVKQLAMRHFGEVVSYYNHHQPTFIKNWLTEMNYLLNPSTQFNEEDIKDFLHNHPEGIVPQKEQTNAAKWKTIPHAEGQNNISELMDQLAKKTFCFISVKFRR